VKLRGLVVVTAIMTTLAAGHAAQAAELRRPARTYRVYVTPSDGRHALILALPGWRLDSTWMEDATGLDSLLAEGFDVAYLDGIQNSWNAGRCCGFSATHRVDDVGYVRGVIADITARDRALDADRIFAVGFSNGGMLAWQLACDDIVRAAVVVAGALTTSCGRPVTVLHIHGSNDRTVPLAGGWSAYCGTSFPDGRHPSLPSGSIYRLVVWHGSHAWPASATADTLTFLSDWSGPSP
jgi:polyhydroxybutyrate depolymerase